MAVDFSNKLLLVLILISSPVEVANPNIFQRFTPRREYSPELNHFLELLHDSKEDLKWIEKTARDVLHAKERRHIQSEKKFRNGYMYPRQDKNNFYNDKSTRSVNNKHIVPARPENDAFPYMYAKQYYRKKRLFDRRRKRTLPRRIESIYRRRNEWDDKPHIDYNKYHNTQFRRDTNYIGEEKPRRMNVDIFPRSQEGVLRKHDFPDDEHVKNDKLIRVSKSCGCKGHKNGPKCQTSNCKHKTHVSCQPGSKCKENHNAHDLIYEDYLAGPDVADIDLDDELIEDSLGDLEVNTDREYRKSKDIFKWFKHKDQSKVQNEEGSVSNSGLDSNEAKIQTKTSKRGKGSAACDFEKCKGDSVKCGCSSKKTMGNSKSESSYGTSKEKMTPKNHNNDKKVGSKHRCGKDSNRSKYNKSDKKGAQQNKRETGHLEENKEKRSKIKKLPGKDFIKKLRSKSIKKEKCKTSDKTDDEDMNDSSTKFGIERLVTRTAHSERSCTAKGCQQEPSTEKKIFTNERNNKEEEEEEDINDAKTKKSHKNCKDCKEHKQSSDSNIKDRLKSKIFPKKSKSSSKIISRHSGQEDLNSYKDLKKLISLISDATSNRPPKDINNLSAQDTRHLLNTNAIKKKVDELMQILNESKGTKRISIDSNENDVENQLKSPTNIIKRRSQRDDHVDKETSTLFTDNPTVIEKVITKMLSTDKTDQKPQYDASSTPSIEKTSDNHINTLDELQEPTSAGEQRNLLNENPVLSMPQQTTTNENLDTTTDNVIQIIKLKRNPLAIADQFFGSQKEGAPHVKKILKEENEPVININQDKSDIHNEDNGISASSSGNTKLERNNRFDTQEPFLGNDYSDNLENYYDYEADYDSRAQREKRDYNKFKSFKSRKLHSVQPSTLQKPKISEDNSEDSSHLRNNNDFIEFYDDPSWDIPLNNADTRIQKRSEDDEYEEADPVIGEKVKYNLIKNSQVRFDNKFNNAQSADEYYAKKTNKHIIDSISGNSLHKMKQREDENDNEDIITIKENFEFFPHEQQETSEISSEPTPTTSDVVSLNPSNSNNIMTLQGNLRISPQVQDKQFLVNIQRSSTLSTEPPTDQNLDFTLQPIEFSSNAFQRDVINPPLMLPRVTIYPHMLLLATKISLNPIGKSLRKANVFPEQSSSSSTESNGYLMFTTPQISDQNSKLSSWHTTKKSTKFTNLLKNKFKHHKDPVLDIIRNNEIGLSISGLKREKKTVAKGLQFNEVENSAQNTDKHRLKRTVTSISPSVTTTPLSESTITYPKKITSQLKSTTYVYLSPKYIEANENEDYLADYSNSDDQNLNRNLRCIHFFNSAKKPTDYKKNFVNQKSHCSKHNRLQKLHLKNKENEKLRKDGQQVRYEEDNDLPYSTIKKYNEDTPTEEKYKDIQVPIERNVLLNFLPLKDNTFLQNHELPIDDSNSYTSLDKPSGIPFDRREYQIVKPSGEGFPFNKIVNPKQHSLPKMSNFNPFDTIFKNGKYHLGPAEIEPEVKYGNDVSPFKKVTSDFKSNKQGSNPQLVYDGEQIRKSFHPFDSIRNIPQYELRSLDDPQSYNQQIQFPPMLQDHFPFNLLDNIREIPTKNVPSSASKSETQSSADSQAIPNQVNYDFPDSTPVLYFPFPSNNDFSGNKQEIKTVKTSHKGGGGIHPVEKNFKSRYYYNTMPTNLDNSAVEVPNLIPSVNENKEAALTPQTISDSNVKHSSQVRDNSFEFSTASNDEWLKDIQKRLQGSTLSICLSLSSFDGTTPTSSGGAIKRFESQVTHTPYEQSKLEGNIIQAKELQIDLLNNHIFDRKPSKFTPKSLISSDFTPKTTSESIPFGTTHSATTKNRIANEKVLNSKPEKNRDYIDDYDAYDDMFETEERSGKLVRDANGERRRLSFTNSKYTLPVQRDFYQRIRKRSRPKQRLRIHPTNRRIRRATNLLPNYLRNIEKYKNGQIIREDSHQFFGNRRDTITETPYDLQLQPSKNVRRRDSINIATSDEATNDKLALAIRESIADLSNKQWSHLLDKDSPADALGKQVYRDNAGVSIEVTIDDSILKLLQQLKEIMLKEIERESCLQLTPDQRSYLQAITSESQTHDLYFKRESPSKFSHETEPGYFMFKGNKKKRLFYDDDNRALQNSELSKEIDYEKTKRDIKIKYKKIKRLLNEYERLDEDSKTKVAPVENYLKRNMRILRSLYKNVLIDENKPESFSSRKRHYMYDSNQITVNPYSTMPYEIIKKETHRIKSPSKEERHRHNKITKIKIEKKREPAPYSSSAKE
ncbi:uncharacterized protein LOC108734001 isoform X2 [Agrilus planipennis]|uniref:Uncharacterized protein LOC108734001 isoform X2 n=1 Tax=Agrilus planipennis TaxID=224129 RepID=A0A1W4WLF7_AGRPL|nr:uncharacterized protein LOC108734001 isoform X2 [Agrilus planipennis]